MKKNHLPFFIFNLENKEIAYFCFMDIKIFKFGGASVNSSKGVINVVSVINRFPRENIVMVVSAMGKMTNSFEELLRFYMSGEHNPMLECYNRIKDFHLELLKELFQDTNHTVFAETQNILDQLLGHILNENNLKKKKQDYDFEYDQLVSFGELLATSIVHHYLILTGTSSRLFDARELIKTDSSYREANVDWKLTEERISLKMSDYFTTKNPTRRVAVIQGFIGGDKHGNTTTLGREGSDFTAAIFAHSLKTKEVTIWKDVPGVMNADPKWFKHARKLDILSYREAIELAFYGASIIHPKTIKPLENANIKLHVKSFLQPELEGTTIEYLANWKLLHPIYILKPNQVLISISPKDFSFIVEENLSQIFDILAKHHVKANVMQNSAISFTICVDGDRLKGSDVLSELQKNYTLRYNENVELITIRHYNPAAIRNIVKEREILMEQKTRNTIQLVLK
jgi:aspartate kinase